MPYTKSNPTLHNLVRSQNWLDLPRICTQALEQVLIPTNDRTYWKWVEVLPRNYLAGETISLYLRQYSAAAVVSYAEIALYTATYPTLSNGKPPMTLVSNVVNVAGLITGTNSWSATFTLTTNLAEDTCLYVAYCQSAGTTGSILAQIQPRGEGGVAFWKAGQLSLQTNPVTPSNVDNAGVIFCLGVDW